LKHQKITRVAASSVLLVFDVYQISDSSTIEENVLNVLHGMLISIPTFWGSEELSKIIILHTDHYSKKNPPAALVSLMKAIAKRAPANVLIPTLCDMWYYTERSPRLVSFFFFGCLCHSSQLY
jgi:hypothetical protein